MRFNALILLANFLLACGRHQTRRQHLGVELARWNQGRALGSVEPGYTLKPSSMASARRGQRRRTAVATDSFREAASDSA
jgi:hypothetical protein